MRIFLTGGSGFVGGAVLRTLSGEHEIRAMSRSDAGDAAIRALGGEPVPSELGGVTPDMLQGCEAVVHCAAHVEAWGPWSLFERINIEGTRQLLSASRAASVRRFVHIGTEAALFHGQPMIDVDESYPLAPNSPFPYSRSKALAEQAVRAANAEAEGFETIVVRPRLVWGPDDKSLLPAVLAMAKAGRFMWLDGGRARSSHTHVDNLAHAIRLALTRGTPGEAYFVLDGPPHSFREFLTRYAATAGVDLGEKSAPGWLVRTAAAAMDAIWRAAGSKTPPPVTPLVANLMSRDCILLDDKARSGLGYRPVVGYEDGMAALEARSQPA